jgi:hypothetical protein
MTSDKRQVGGKGIQPKPAKRRESESIALPDASPSRLDPRFDPRDFGL